MKNLWIFNKNRIRILHSLYTCADEQCGCDLIEVLDIPKNLLSYHIKMLRDNGLIEEKRCGQKKLYTIVTDQKEYVEDILGVLEMI